MSLHNEKRLKQKTEQELIHKTTLDDLWILYSMNCYHIHSKTFGYRHIS